MKACVHVSEDVTIKEISVSTVPQVLLSPIQLKMGGVTLSALFTLHDPLSKEQTDGSLLWSLDSDANA